MTHAPRTSPVGSAAAEIPDPARLEKVKDLLHCLGNTVSAMKIFPSEHVTIGNFVDLLTEKFTAFLGTSDKLQIGVEEFSFTYCGRPVYTDEVAIKSLPFFFFKDGLQILFFYQGLDRAEILEFLELIKNEAQKAAEDSDIVVALWERDFANIQYYAPDEFLENRILSEAQEARFRDMPDLPDELAHERIEVRVDTSKFTRGRIDLDDADRREVEEAAASPEEDKEPHAPSEAGEGEGAEADGPGEEGGQVSPAAAMDPTLTESELGSLETMIRVNRTISAEEEYIGLMVEIIYLEEDLDHCRASLEALLEYHFDRLQRGHFQVPVLIIQKIHELERHLAEASPKTPLLDEFLRRTISPQTVEAVKSLLEKKKTMDWESLLAFFELVGPPSLGLATDLFELAPDGEARHKIVGFVERTGGPNPGLLAGLADAARPAFAREIVGILARLPGRRGIPHLAAFVNFQNKDIKAEAIEVLSRVRDEMANRILAGFLNDPDEEVRIQATLSLDPAQGGARVQQILREAAGREFIEKSLKEKETLLAFLGRTRSAEALEFLRRTVKRAPLFGSRKLLELRLAAVAGLEQMGTAEALAVLQQGAIGRTRKVREACQAALQRLPPAGLAKG